MGHSLENFVKYANEHFEDRLDNQQQFDVQLLAPQQPLLTYGTYSKPASHYPPQMFEPRQVDVIQPTTVMYSNNNWSGLQNTIIDNGTKKQETDKKVLPPQVIDNIEECKTYVFYQKAEVSTNIYENDERALVKTSCKNKLYNKQEVIANIYVHTVDRYGDVIQIDTEYLVNRQQRKRAKVLLLYEDYVSGRVTHVFKKQGILCFNADMVDKKLNSYMTELLRTKLQEHPIPPMLCGFSKWNGQDVFCSAEFYERENIPIFVNKHFDVCSDTSLADSIKKVFRISQSCNYPELFWTLNLIRIVGMLSTPLSTAGKIFTKIVFVKGDSRKLSKFFQVYDRWNIVQKPYSINVTEKEFKTYLGNIKDDVLMLKDNENDSLYKKEQGRVNIFRLNEMIDDNRKELKFPFLSVIFSERLIQEIPAEKVFLIDASSLKIGRFSDREIMSQMYDFERKLVHHICSEMPDFLYYFERNIDFETFCDILDIGLQYKKSEDFLKLLIFLIRYIARYIPFKYKNEFEKRMEWYFGELSLLSEKYCSGGNMAKEFEIVLNRMISEDKIELLLHSELDKGTNSSHKVPPVFLGEDYLYFINDAFETVVNEMQLSPNLCSVRKKLKEAGILKYGNDLQVQVTLYDRHYSGRQLVTAVKSSILSEESMKKLKGGIFNFEPCSDKDNTRIPVGIDEQGRMVYLSPEHPELKNKHIQIIGDSGSGKSIAGNLIVRSKYEHGENIIYIDYSNSNSETKMLSHGFEKEFYDAHICTLAIEEYMEKVDLQQVLQEMQEKHTILIFRSTKYDENVEQFLKLLYELIVADDNLNVTLVIDEVHELSYKKDSGLSHIIEKGRGNGISLISILQAPHELKPKQMSMLNGSATKLIFSLSDNEDAHTCAEKNGLKKMYKFAELLGDMPRQHCLVVGFLEDTKGEIKPKRFIKVKIPNVGEKL